MYSARYKHLSYFQFVAIIKKCYYEYSFIRFALNNISGSKIAESYNKYQSYIHIERESPYVCMYTHTHIYMPHTSYFVSFLIAILMGEK